MVGDYSEHLDETALRHLAKATGQHSHTTGRSLTAFDLSTALASPEAADILAERHSTDYLSRLQLAIAIHQTSDRLAKQGWTTRDPALIELPLLTFSGQTSNQRTMFDLLTSMLDQDDPRIDLASRTKPRPKQTVLQRFSEAVERVNKCDPISRAGALRFLGDEALFISSFFPRAALECRVDDSIIEMCESVLPNSAATLVSDISAELVTLLDIYLVFGSLWYRAAAAGLVFPFQRESLSSLAKDFPTARKFLVRVHQDTLSGLSSELFAHIKSPER